MPRLDGRRPPVRSALGGPRRAFTVERGEIVGIIGPNGAGKSTLFNLIAGAMTPSSGDIRFLDHSIAKAKPYQVARLGLAHLPDPKPFKQLTVRENVMLSALRRAPHAATRRPASQRRRWSSSASVICRCIGRQVSPWACSRSSRWRARWRPSRRCCSSTRSWPG